MANDPRFEVYPQLGDHPGDPHRDRVPTGEYGWRFRAANGKISAVGGEGFTREEDAERAVRDGVEAILNVALSGGKMAGARNLPIMAEVLRGLPILRVDE